MSDTLSDTPEPSPWRMDPSALTALRLQQARAALDTADPYTAIIEAEELLDEDPDNLDALFLVGDACLELNDAPGAHAAFSRYVELNPDDAGALAGLSVSCFELTDYDGCVAMARRAIALEPTMGEAWHYLGLGLERQGQDRESRRAFARAEKLEPDAWPLVKPLSQAEWNVALGRALELLPRSLKAWYAHTRVVTRAMPELADLRAVQPPISPTVPALYMGEPPDDAPDPWRTWPDAVHVYRANLEREALWTGDLPRTIADALRSEALDWLGLPPDAHPIRS